MIDKQDIVGVVCHDAGGSEIISSYILQNNLSVNYCLEGPAIKIFKRKIGDIENKSLLDVINNSDWILCGSSWQSDIEWKALYEAKNNKKKAITYLDHWVNYKERFIRSNVTHFPDEIWVGDDYAMKIIDRSFPNIKKKKINNPYFLEIRREYEKHKNVSLVNNNSILFVSDNISGAAKKQFNNEAYYGYTDMDSLNLLIKNLDNINININKINIRPHPSESKDKYLWAVNKYKGLVEVVDNSKLLIDISHNKYIAGTNSMALVVAILCEKKVYNCLPRGVASNLPFTKITSIS